MIDPVIVSDAFTVLDSGTMNVDEFISDHKATYIAIQISIKISTSYYREVWNYRNADSERLNQLIRSYNWDSIINDKCAIGDACINFTDVFLKFCKECISCQKVLIRQNDKPWFNSEIRHNVRLRDKLRKRFFKTKRKSDHVSFKQQRNKVNNVIKYAKENFIHKIDDILGNPEIESSSKTFWQVMGRFMRKTGTSIYIPPLHKQDNTLAFSDFEKAQELNSYFALISTIDDTTTDLPYFEKRCNVDFTQIRINESEVVDVLKILKLNKATGPDGIKLTIVLFPVL